MKELPPLQGGGIAGGILAHLREWKKHGALHLFSLMIEKQSADKVRKCTPKEKSGRNEAGKENVGDFKRTDSDWCICGGGRCDHSFNFSYPKREMRFKSLFMI